MTESVPDLRFRSPAVTVNNPDFAASRGLTAA